jgi:hypothetical protein
MQHPDKEAKFGDNVNVNLLPRFEVRKQYYHLVIPPDFV